METQGWLALAIGAVSVIAFVRKWAPPEAVAIGIPVALVATGVLDPEFALRGFGNHAVIALGAIFVVGAGLQGSGLAALIARAILQVSGRNEVKIVALLMASTAVVSAFMSNAASTALFLPTAVTLSRRALISPSRLLLPMASAAVLGGTMTLIGTPPNLLVSDYLQSRTGAPLPIFQFGVVGVPIVLMGILFTITLGRRLLPERSNEERMRDALLPEELAESYGLARNLCRLRILPQSQVAGKTIAEAGIRARYALSIVLIMRPGRVRQRYLDPRPDLRLRAGDHLYIEGDGEAAWAFAEEETLQFALAGPQAVERILGRGQTLAEVALSPRSGSFGSTLKELGFRSRYGLTALRLWRRGAPMDAPADTPLELGDAILVAGTIASIRKLAGDPDFIVLSDQSATVDVRRAPLALFLLVVAVLPPILGLVPLAVSALAAAILMVMTRCVSAEDARRSIEWKVVFLIAGTLPMGAALEQTGVAAATARLILEVTAPLGAPATFAGLFLLAMTVSVTSSNSAAAVIIAPIAAEAAVGSGIDMEKAILAVAYGCSCAFILPLAQWNLLVMGPGGYRASDFIRFGSALSLVMAATAVGLLSLF